jgi:5-methylcytosine-specific restriction endonuclease McrA
MVTSQRRKGRTDLTEDAVWEAWARSGGICHYTGAPLTLGYNASVDHRISKRAGGSCEAENLVFVHRNVNLAKNDLDESEFLCMCRLIAARFPREINEQ